MIRLATIKVCVFCAVTLVAALFDFKENMMKSDIGIIKPIDDLGRLVIPKEIRERALLEDKVEVILTDEGVLVRNAEYDLVKIKRQNSK